MVEVSPRAFQQDVALNAQISATFNEAIKPDSVTAQAFQVNAGDIAGELVVNGSTATLIPAQPLPRNANVTVKLSGIQDVAGNALVEDYSWTFTTGIDPDTTAPRAITTLEVEQTGANSVTLGWYASGDDLTFGQATSYDLRYTTGADCAVTEENFETATKVEGLPAPKPFNEREQFVVTGLGYSTKYCFALKVADDVPHVSGLSNVASTTTSEAPLESITVDPAAPSVPAGRDLAFTATGHFADGSTRDITTEASWTSSDTALATISNNPRGLATGVAEGGPVTITATKDGKTGTATLTVIAPAIDTIAIVPEVNTINVSETEQYTATATYSDGSNGDVTATATWASSNTDVATIDATGLATGVAVGESNITASLDGVTSNAAVLTVTEAVLESLTGNVTSVTLNEGEVFQLTLTGNYSDGSTRVHTEDATWSSTDTSVATVSDAAGTKGEVTAVVSGTSEISAAFGGKTAFISVEVSTVTSVAVSPTTVDAPMNEAIPLTVTATYSSGATRNVSASATWASTHPGVTVNAEGALVAYRASVTADLTATYGGQSTGAVAVTTCGLVVNEIDYDQVDADLAEFVELFNTCDVAVSTADTFMVLFNGNSDPGGLYFNGAPFAFAEATVPAKGFVVFGSTNVTVPDGVQKVDMPGDNLLQNGTRDAISIINTTARQLVDTVTYEGTQASFSAVLDGTTYVAQEGLAAAGEVNAAPNMSINRSPDGTDTNDNSVDFQSSTTVTPGATNVVTAPPPPATP